MKLYNIEEEKKLKEGFECVKNNRLEEVFLGVPITLNKLDEFLDKEKKLPYIGRKLLKNLKELLVKFNIDDFQIAYDFIWRVKLCNNNILCNLMRLKESEINKEIQNYIFYYLIRYELYKEKTNKDYTLCLFENEHSIVDNKNSYTVLNSLMKLKEEERKNLYKNILIMVASDVLLNYFNYVVNNTLLFDEDL